MIYPYISTDPDSRRVAWLINYAWTFIGTPYRWGGDDPSGVDCSGFVSECLQSVGILNNKERLTADGLLKRFVNHPKTRNPGSLIFWVSLEQQRAYHVGIIVDERQVIHSGGGGKVVQSPEDAWRHNAFVKLRPFDFNRGNVRIHDPFGRT